MMPSRQVFFFFYANSFTREIPKWIEKILFFVSLQCGIQVLKGVFTIKISSMSVLMLLLWKLCSEKSAIINTFELKSKFCGDGFVMNALNFLCQRMFEIWTKLLFGWWILNFWRELRVQTPFSSSLFCLKNTFKNIDSVK